MSGNGRGNMRPASRSPPFLVAGLLIAMCILAFNYWSVSSKNKDLNNQLESLQVDFRSVSDKHLAVEKRASDLSSQAAEFQSMVSKLQNSATEKDSRVSTLTAEVNSLNSQLEQVRNSATEKDNRLSTLTDEVNSLKTQLEHAWNSAMEREKSVSTLTDEVNSLNNQLEQVRNSAMKKDDRLSMLTDHVNSLNEQLERHRNQAQAHIQQVDDEKKSVLEELAEVRSQLEDERRKVVTCDKGMCKDVVRDLMKVMLDSVGKKKVMSALSPQHPDILTMIDDLLQGASDPKEQQPQGNPQPFAQGDVNPQQAAGQAGLPVPGMELGQNPNMGQNPQNPEAAQNPDLGQAPEAAQKPNVGQNLLVDQNPNMVQDSNVVQMQQQPGAQLGGQDQPPENMDPNNPQNVVPQPPDEGVVPRKEEKVKEQEIVAQNIPQRDGEEAALPHDAVNHELQDLNAAPAQEDLNAAPARMDIIEDELDRQAQVNEANAGVGNLDDNLHVHLEDLSRNQIGAPHNDNNRDVDRADIEEEEVKDDIERDDINNHLLDRKNEDERELEDDGEEVLEEESEESDMDKETWLFQKLMGNQDKESGGKEGLIQDQLPELGDEHKEGVEDMDMNEDDDDLDNIMDEDGDLAVKAKLDMEEYGSDEDGDADTIDAGMDGDGADGDVDEDGADMDGDVDGAEDLDEDDAEAPLQ